MLTACVVVAVLVVSTGAAPDKRLRNVIITSFGEMPYEPAEGFYQSDVFPVGIDSVLKEQTMDVALRTGILVEDPNEGKKGTDQGSMEDDVSSTNLKRQVSEGQSNTSEDNRLQRRAQTRNPKGFKEESEEVNYSPRNYGYEFSQTRKPYSSRNGYGDLNSGGSRDIGEGWNLQDAKEILQGRNYNVLVQTPMTYPMPASREHPPPTFIPHPVFQPFPQFNHNAFPRQRFGPHAVPAAHTSHVNYDERRANARTQSARDKRQFLSTLESEQHQPRVRFSTPQNFYYSEDYLRGI